MVKEINFVAVHSNDPDGTITQYRWNFGDGSPEEIAAAPFISHTYTAPGVYPVTLIVTDNDGATGTETQNITIENTPPISSFTYQKGGTLLGVQSVSFSSNASNDPDGNIMSYLWDFGNGTQSTAANPTRNFTSGTYTVQLTVTDDNGASHTSSQVLTINAGVL